MALQLMATNGPFFAPAALMDGPRGHFLAGAAFAQNQDGGVGGGDFADGVESGCDGGLVPSMPSKALPVTNCCICADIRCPGRRRGRRA